MADTKRTSCQKTIKAAEQQLRISTGDDTEIVLRFVKSNRGNVRVQIDCPRTVALLTEPREAPVPVRISVHRID